MELYTEILNFSLNTLKILGLDPNKLIHSLSLIMCILGAWIIYLDFYQLTTDEITGNLISVVLQTFFIVLQVFLPMLSIYLKADKHCILIHCVSNLWTYKNKNKEKEDENVTILRQFQKFQKAFYILVLCGVVCYLGRLLIQGVMPIICHIPEFIPFSLFAAFLLLYMSYIGYVVAGFITLCYGYLVFLYVNFKILKNTLVSINLVKIKDHKKLTKVQQQLKTCVDFHNFLFSIIEYFNDVFGMPLLVLYFNTTIAMCFELVRLSWGSHSASELLGPAVYIMGMVIELAAVSVLSVAVTSEASLVVLSIYKMNWPDCENLALRKHLIFMMQRTQKVPRITAGKMFAIDLETFTKMMKTVFSCVTVVHAIEPNENELSHM